MVQVVWLDLMVMAAMEASVVMVLLAFLAVVARVVLVVPVAVRCQGLVVPAALVAMVVPEASALTEWFREIMG
jgi:hypothetical protein